MASNLELVSLFFRDLKNYNSTNFRTLEHAKLDKDDATVHKAFSSVVTRYFIFCERHPEVTKQDMQILYFKLKIDMIAHYFANYPASSVEYLKPFQLELLQHVETTRGGEDYATTTPIQNFQLATASASTV